MENEERKTGEKNDVFPCLVQKRKHKGKKMLKKKIHGAREFFSSRFGRKTGKKREKGGA